jgi:hypothetical protein
MVSATGITMSGMGRGTKILMAAAMPPRSAAASMVFPNKTPTSVVKSTQRGRKSRMAWNSPRPETCPSLEER